METHEKLDQELAMAALAKRQRGESPSAKELAALKRWEKRREEKARWEYYQTIPQKHWRAMSGRQTKVLNEQSALYGIPFGGATISLPLVVKALHDFLAKNGHKLLKDDEAGLLGGPPTESLERLRLAKARREEFAYERDRGLWRRVDEMQTALGIFAGIIRQGIDTLQRVYGQEARQIMAECLEDAIRSMERALVPDRPDSIFMDEGNDGGSGTARTSDAE